MKTQPKYGSALEALGLLPQNPYKEKTVEEYTKSLNKLNMIDLQNHALTLGIRPSPERTILVKHLQNTFRETNARLEGFKLKKEENKSIGKRKEKAALEILKRGI